MGSKPKTCVRYNEPGHAHALTFSCHRKCPLLDSDQARDGLVQSLNAARTRHSFDIWAYVIMPDHVHLVIWPRLEAYSISTILHAIKRPVAFRMNTLRRKAGGSSQPFWQAGGGYDRNLWKTDTIHKEIDYMHANPVRRQLCETPEEWRFSSAGFWAGCADAPLAMDGSVPPKEMLGASDH